MSAPAWGTRDGPCPVIPGVKDKILSPVFFLRVIFQLLRILSFAGLYDFIAMQKSSSSSSSSSGANRTKRRQKSSGKSKAVSKSYAPSVRRTVSVVVDPQGRPRARTALNPYFRQLAKQFLTPLNAGGSMYVAPNPTPGQVCARHIHKSLDIKQSDYPDGVSIAMFPNLFLPGFITSKAAQLLPAAGLGVCAVSGSFRLKQPIGTAADQQHLIAEAGSSMAPMQLLVTPDSALLNYLAMEVTPNIAGQVVNYEIQNVTPGKCTPQFIILTKTVAGAWGSVKTENLAENASAAGSFTLAANSTHIAFTNANTGGKEPCWKLTLGLPLSQIHAGAGQSLAPAFEEFILENDIESGRVMSMSLLATNTSSALSDGGTINVGRVPHNFDPFRDPVGAMAGLPDNRRYQGAAKTGGYCFWIPGQEDEFQLDGVSEKHRSLAEAEYVFIRIDSWPEGASFRLQFDWVVEFYTPNQLYEKVLTPPLTDQFRQFYYQLLLTPCAMCNPSHAEVLKDLLARGLSTVKSGVDFYDEHKGLIHGAFELLAAALA